ERFEMHLLCHWEHPRVPRFSRVASPCPRVASRIRLRIADSPWSTAGRSDCRRTRPTFAVLRVPGQVAIRLGRCSRSRNAPSWPSTSGKSSSIPKGTTMATAELREKHCVPCEGGIPALSRGEAEKLLAKVPQWKPSPDGKRIRREWKVRDF